MASRHLILVSLATAFLGLVHAAPVLGGDNSPAQWNHTSAAQYLDARGENWFKFGSTQLAVRAPLPPSASVATASYLMHWRGRSCVKFRMNIRRPDWKRKSSNRPKAELPIGTSSRRWNTSFSMILTNPRRNSRVAQRQSSTLFCWRLTIDLEDANNRAKQLKKPSRSSGRHRLPTASTEARGNGSTSGSNLGSRASSRYLGATVAAIAIGAVPGNGHRRHRRADTRYGSIPSATYLRKTTRTKTFTIASGCFGLRRPWTGSLSPEEKKQLIEQVLAEQQPSGGWSLGSLGDFTHGEIKTPVTTPDGYATGLILHVTPARRPYQGESPGEQRPFLAAVESRSFGRLACPVGQQGPRTRVDQCRRRLILANSCGMQRRAMPFWH